MKTIAALLGSIINLVGLVNMVIDKSKVSIENTLDVAVDITAMAKAGSSTALKSFEIENEKALADLEKELQD